jgi:protein-tyrosine-phosphatase
MGFGVGAVLRRRASRAWRATDAPLILCHGAINRSAFAAGLARQRGRLGARAAGFYPQAGRSAPPATIASAARYGVDLSEYRSAAVTRRELAQARAIFVFDLRNLLGVLARYPPALLRTHLVGSLDDGRDMLIADPHGRGDEVLERTVERIAGAIEHAESRS